MKITLNKAFARNRPVNSYDVRQVKRALNRLGYYIPSKNMGITEIVDQNVFKALKQFQRDHDLKETGIVRPDDETIRRLNQTLKSQSGDYIWQTVGDEKVRTTHAVLNGTIRNWNDSPDPGEEHNCRCDAKPVGIIRSKRERNRVCIDLHKRHEQLEQEISEKIPRQIAIAEREIENKKSDLQAWKKQLALEMLPSISVPSLGNRKFINLGDAFDILGIKDKIERIEKIRKKIIGLEETIKWLDNKIVRLKHKSEDTYEQLADIEEQIRILCPDD